ncbi:hypothetical protein EV702DRAFT_1160969 [Suillus placidus]|uniref:Uncharacterized protein n=1 Tax=Suillus placidus TaxID=48579 RepID=A0A9P6ZH22_9AGAM|nr:hypothetical protein EV702DRAFT_1160969 [Suillus placidus]
MTTLADDSFQHPCTRGKSYNGKSPRDCYSRMPNTGFPSSPRMPGAATGGESLQLAAPEAFSRPPNAAQPYTPFSVMRIVSKQAGQHHNCRGSSCERAHLQLCEGTIKSKAGCTYLLSGTRGIHADGMTGASMDGRESTRFRDFPSLEADAELELGVWEFLLFS